MFGWTLVAFSCDLYQPLTPLPCGYLPTVILSPLYSSLILVDWCVIWGKVNIMCSCNLWQEKNYRRWNRVLTKGYWASENKAGYVNVIYMTCVVLQKVPHFCINTSFGTNSWHVVDMLIPPPFYTHWWLCTLELEVLNHLAICVAPPNH